MLKISFLLKNCCGENNYGELFHCGEYNYGEFLDCGENICGILIACGEYNYGQYSKTHQLVYKLKQEKLGRNIQKKVLNKISPYGSHLSNKRLQSVQNKR